MDIPWSESQCVAYRKASLGGRKSSPEPTRSSANFARALRDGFDRIDRDGDGTGSQQELIQAMRETDQEPEFAALLATLRGREAKLCRDGLARLAGDALLGATFDRLSATELKPLRPLAQENFEPALVRQGQAGTCISLAALRFKPAQEIEAMFSQNPNGTITVSLADGSKSCVPDVTLAERMYHAAGESGNAGRHCLRKCWGS